MPPPAVGVPTLNVNSSSNLVQDLYYAFSVRGSAVANSRPIWNVTLSVDSTAFYIGAIGSVALGYMLDQYGPRNIDNIAYINEQGESGSFFLKIIKSTFFHPFSVLKRFVTGGVIYILIGYATHKYIGAARPLACGALTGLYFSYGGASFTDMLKAVAGFATFAVLMEKAVDITVRAR